MNNMGFHCQVDDNGASVLDGFSFHHIKKITKRNNIIFINFIIHFTPFLELSHFLKSTHCHFYYYYTLSITVQCSCWSWTIRWIGCDVTSVTMEKQ